MGSSGLEISFFIFPLNFFSIFLHLNINTTRDIKNPSFLKEKVSGFWMEGV
jgi:hypothetical protein